MPCPAEMTDEHREQIAGAEKRESEISKALLLEAVSGISQYAHHARRFTMTDQKIDRFVAEMLCRIGSEAPMTAVDAIPLLIEAESLFERAKKLYLWSCEAFSRPPEVVRTTMIQTEKLDEKRIVKEGASHMRRRHAHQAAQGLDIEWDRWFQVLLNKLSSIANVAISSLTSGHETVALFGLLHRTLSATAAYPTLSDMVALVQSVETEAGRLMTRTTKTDTTSVQQSEIFVISDPSPPSTGQIRLG